MPVWVLALGTTLGMQTVASFLGQSLPIIAPLLLAGTGLAPERIGNLSSLNALGTILFLLFGGPVLARLGPVRMLQVGAAAAAAGLAVASIGWWPLLVIAATLMGMGYGPSPVAGSRILAATAPPRHRTLIFSVKQAGAPLGGALAGLVLAPTAAAFGWFWALILAIGIGVMAALLLEPARVRLDLEREPDRPIRPSALFHPNTAAAPFRLLRANPVLVWVTGLAISFAVVQGSLFSFSVTYLVTDRHMALPEAGLAYASLQFSGVFARILLGWFADRTGRPARNLTIQACVGAVMVIVYGSLPDHVSTAHAAIVAGATGFLCASWNGIFMAEIARLSPRDRIVEATSSSGVMTFLGYLVGPSIFSGLVTWSGSYRAAFLAIAAQLAAVAALQSVILIRRGGANPAAT
jgi:MFS family permease